MDIKAERHQVGLNASHIDICRFRNREEDNWVALIDYFRRANSDLTGSSKYSDHVGKTSQLIIM